MPLQPDDYPVLGEIAESLKHDATAISVVTANDPELYGGHAQSFINAIGGPPSMPNSDSNHPFWDDFRHVVDVQQTRRTGGNPSELLRLPDMWEGKNIHEVAEAVRADYPGHYRSSSSSGFGRREPNSTTTSFRFGRPPTTSVS
jgi:hypothetical protein